VPEPPAIAIDPRVVFAAERTLLAWIRTGLSLMGFGFVVARFGLFLREFASAAQHRNVPSPAPGFSLWIGTALVGLGVVVNLIAIFQHVRVIRRLNRGETMFPATISPGTVIASALALLGLVISVYLFCIAP